jgi:hypothetical protein
MFTRPPDGAWHYFVTHANQPTSTRNTLPIAIKTHSMTLPL